MSDRRQIASSIRLEPIVRHPLAAICKLPKQCVFYFSLQLILSAMKVFSSFDRQGRAVAFLTIFSSAENKF
jgi:hypothetical protein